MHGISVSGFLASASLLRRVSLMARFIKERHAAEFEAYWRDNYKGKAEAREALQFFSDQEFSNSYYIMRVEK